MKRRIDHGIVRLLHQSGLSCPVVNQLLGNKVSDVQIWRIVNPDSMSQVLATERYKRKMKERAKQ